MKIAIYPGSFNPWHDGHKDIVNKALTLFDKVIIAQGLNPEKTSQYTIPDQFNMDQDLVWQQKVVFKPFSGLLVDLVTQEKADAVIRGLRNSQDFEYEKNQQYWNEDLGLTVPVVYLISDRSLTHISSSAIRIVKKLQK